MADTFRALCSELVEKIEYTWGNSIPADVWELLNCARNELALTDEPAVPAPPADGEVTDRAAELLQRQVQLEAAAKHRKCLIEPPSWCDDGQAHAWHAGWEARDEMLLQPWPPVPVSEGLPKPKDCVPHPRTKRGNWCWGFERCEVSLARPARWRLMHMETVEMEASHWLPAHALPLPEASE